MDPFGVTVGALAIDVALELRAYGHPVASTRVADDKSR